MNDGTSEVTKAAFRVLVFQIKQLTKERDEARREVCNWSVGVGLKATSQAVAEERGWDCYEHRNLVGKGKA